MGRVVMYVRIELPVGNPWQPLALRRAGRARLRLIRILGAVLVVLGLPNLFTGELVGVMLGTFLVLVGGYVIALPTALIRYAMRGLPKIAQTEPAVLEI